MKERQYPFTAYVLTPAMLIKPVELVRRSEWFGDYHETAGGNTYSDSQLHNTPQAAIAEGSAKLNEQRSRLQKQQSNLEKRAANLEKAAAGL